MEANADGELVQLLTALLSADKSTRTTAEAALSAGREKAGFPPRLVAFACGGPAGAEALPLRQMALTVLRRLVIESWQALHADDQEAVRRALVASTCEGNASLRALIHESVACCAAAPTSAGVGQWPELYARLGAGITGADVSEAQSCVELVTVLLDKCDLDVAAMLGPLQEPMLRLASADATPPALRRKCVQAHAAGVTTLIHGEAPEAAISAAVAVLPSWVAVHAALCAGPEGWDERERVASAFTAIRLSTGFCRHRPLEAALADGPIEGVLRPACMLVQSIEPAYSRGVIDADDGGASEEEDGGADLVAQLMELVQAMLARPKLRVLLKGHARRLLQLLVPFMRITEAQVRSWREDPNEFLACEDDEKLKGAAVRLSGEGLVGEFQAHMKREATKAIAGIIGELLERGAACAAEAGAWKLTELGLFLFTVVAIECPVRSLQRGDLAPLAPVVLQTAGRLCGDTGAPEFLRARAFALLHKLGDAVCALLKNDVPALLKAAAASLQPSVPLPVRISACRAFCRFLTVSDDSALRESLLLEHGVLSSLGALLRDADEEVLHLALESLTVITKMCPSAIAKVEASFSPLVLELWRRSANDPLLLLSVLDLVGCATSSDVGLRRSMEAQLLPVVVTDLKEGTEAIVTASAIDLYGVLLKRADTPFAAPMWQCAEAVVAAVLRSDESGLLQNACDVLCSLVKRSPAQIIEAGLLAPMLQAVERLLRPDLDDNACLFVGPLVTLLLQHFGGQLPQDLARGLLHALVARLAKAELPFLQQSLIVVVARLLHEDLAGVVALLGGLEVPAPPSAPAASELPVGASGLELLLYVWLACSKEIRSRHSRNVAFSALCKLHLRCAEDAALRAARTGGNAPLPQRLLAVLVAALEFENERCEKLAKRAQDDEDDEDDEDEDDEACIDDDDDDIIEASGRSRPMGKLLSELVDFEDDDDSDGEFGGGDTFQEVERADPLYSLDLRSVLVQHLGVAGQQVGAPPELAGKAAAAVAAARQGAAPIAA